MARPLGLEFISSYLLNVTEKLLVRRPLKRTQLISVLIPSLR
jgi:hypothetical protein